MASSDDLAEQQLFAEIQASARKVQHAAPEPPSSAAVQSANLLNAARLNRSRAAVAAASSSPSHVSHDLGPASRRGMGGMARAAGAGKLKPVSLLRDDLAKIQRPEFARRGDPFEPGFSSPEKVAASPRMKPRMKPLKNRKERVAHHVSPAPPEPEEDETRRDTPPASPPPPILNGNHLEEVAATLPDTSKRLADNIISRVGSSRDPAQQPHPKKRKAEIQASKRGRPSKSPRRDAAGAPEDDTTDTTQAKSGSGPQRARGTSPQVIVAAADSTKRNTRAGKVKQGETNPPPTDAAPVPINARRDGDEGHTRTRLPQEVISAVDSPGEQEHQDEPPRSAQKAPEQGLEPSDAEMNTSERSRPAKRTQKGPSSVEMERRQRRKGTKKTSSESANGPVTASAEEPELEPEQELEQELEQEPLPQPQVRRSKPRRGRLPQASKSSMNAEIASGQDGGNGETAAGTRQTRSKTKTAPTHLVFTPTAQGGRSQHSTSEHHHPQAGRHDARDKTETLRGELSFDEEDDPHQVATDVDDSAQSSGGDESIHKDGDHDHSVKSSDIEKVFKFLESSEHSGKCQSENAIAIMKACRRALRILADSESNLDDVSVTTKHIQVMLSKYGAGSDGKELKSLKVDAYAYLFRQVVGYLKSLHDWLSEKHSDFESFLDAMRIITPLVNAILSTNDRIADWKIKIPSRYKGSRLVKDVETNLIAPLRRLSGTYLTTLRSLKDEARKKHAYEELARERREREQQKQTKQEMEDLRIQKLNDWIELHVCRLRLEPDPRRRHALRMRQEYFDKKMATWTDDETEGREELDANGFPFSRVDLFKKRVVPPASPSSADRDREWTDEQIGALIEGLENFAGSHVFRNIFQHHCGVGQPLRRFSVPEITAKAVGVRRRLLKTYEERGWTDVPKWIHDIPILP